MTGELVTLIHTASITSGSMTNGYLRGLTDFGVIIERVRYEFDAHGEPLGTGPIVTGARCLFPWHSIERVDFFGMVPEAKETTR